MRRKWKTAFLTILDYSTMPSTDVIESLRRLGYEGIEWTMDHFDPDKPIAQLHELVWRTPRRWNGSIPNYGAYRPDFARRRRTQTKKSIGLCAL